MRQRLHCLRFPEEGKKLARPADDFKFQTLEMRRECFNLPLSLYTEWYRQMDLKNMFHLYSSCAETAVPAKKNTRRDRDIPPYPKPASRASALLHELSLQLFLVFHILPLNISTGGRFPPNPMSGRGGCVMEKKILVVAIAIGTIVISTLLQLFMRNREVSPATKKLLWGSFAAGVAALIVLSIVILKR
jgi:hypothetical protein